MCFRDSLAVLAKLNTSRQMKFVLSLSVLGFLVVPAAPGPAQTAATQPADAAATTGQAPKARCDKPIYDFGEVWSGDKVEHDFIIHNDGDAVLKITSVRAGCGCTATKHDKTIEPGKTGKVHTVLNTRGQRKEMRKPVYIYTDDPNNKRFTLTLKGKVKARVKMEPTAGAQFGIVRGKPADPITVKLTNNTSTPMKIEPAAPGKEHEIFKAAIKEIEPGKVYDVTVTAQGPFQLGRKYYARLSFSTGIKEEPRVTIGCRLSSPRELEISRKSFMLGAVPPRDMSHFTDITYNGEGQLNLLSAVSTHEAVKPIIKTLEPGRKYRVAWRLPKGLDISSDKPIHVKIATDYEKQREIDIPIRVRAPRRTNPRTSSVSAESLIGKQAPRVSVKTTDGKNLQLGTADGKVRAVNFWASYCRHSRRQLPMMQRIGAIYRHRGVEFVMVSLDGQRPPSEITNKAEHLDVDLPIGLDANHRVSTRFGVKGRCPTLVLIGKSGEIEAVHRGAAGGVEDLVALERQITAELDVLLRGGTRNGFPRATPIHAELTTINELGGIGQKLDETPMISIESTRQDTGSHKSGALVKYNLYYRNDGRKPLTVTKVSGTEGIKINPDYAKTLQPTMSGMIKIEFSAPKEPGEFSRNVTIESNAPGRSPLVVVLTGATRPYVEADPVAVDFSRNPRLHAMPRLVTLSYNGQGTVKYLKAESSSPKFEAQVQAMEGTPYAKLTVKSKPPFEIGETRGVIRVTTDCPEQPTLELPVMLFLQARIEIDPAEVVLPKTGQQHQSRVSITNNGERPLHILGASRSNEKIKTQFHPQRDGKSYRLQLTFPAGYQPAPKGDRVTIRTDDAEYKEIVIPIRLQK